MTGGVALLRPWGAAVAPDGKRAVVSDMGFHQLFVVEVATGERRELAGQRASGADDGEGTEARFWRPRGVAFAPDGRKSTPPHSTLPSKVHFSGLPRARKALVMACLHFITNSKQ